MTTTISYDFSGIATAYEVLCQDDRVIKTGAFDHQKGQVVPMVWRHSHEDIRNVVGHAHLGVSVKPPGMRVKAIFNDTDEGRRAKLLVRNKDVKHLSIWANQLVEKKKVVANNGEIREVKKGTIREVSLVLAGKNPGAYIDDVVRHSEDPFDPDTFVEDGVIIHTEYPIELFEEPEGDPDPDPDIIHQEDGSTVATILESLTSEQERLFNVILHSAITGEKTPPAKSNAQDGTGLTVKEVFDTLSEEQKNTLYYMAGELSQEGLSQEGDPDDMTKKTHNIFEGDEDGDDDKKLSHENLGRVLTIARDTRAGSLRDVFAAQEITLSHSITDIDFMFPDAKKVDAGGPQFYSRPMEWVEQVLNACKTRPFSRIKSQYADLTQADARAKGYVTGALKVEEVIAVLKRVTTPQTIYKLQKLDRDDIIDITDFDVVMWLKGEMRLMLREELARAILISDGRNDTGADAILAANVRPIYNDSAVYTISKIYNDIANEQDLVDFTAAEAIILIDYIADARKEYRGSGSPTFYCQPEVLAKLLLVRDTTGRRIHPTEASLAEALRVRNLVEIPPMSLMERSAVVNPPGLPSGTYDIATLGVIINLSDYVIGADKGGKTAFFDDFDLDYNKYTYLYETRLSGALINPLSAMAIELVTAKTA